MCVGEHHPAFGKSFDVGGLVELRGAIQRHVAPAKIIGEDNDHVRRFGRRIYDRGKDKACEKSEDVDGDFDLHDG